MLKGAKNLDVNTKLININFDFVRGSFEIQFKYCIYL